MAASDANPPRLVQAFYGIGTAYVQLDSRTLRVTGEGYTAKLTTHKRSGSEVSLDGFFNQRISRRKCRSLCLSSSELDS
jgi:hypothetical protein